MVATWKPILEEWLNRREEEYLCLPADAKVPSLPSTSDNMINVHEVAKQLGCARSYLYDYSELSLLLDLFAEGQGLSPSCSRTPAAGDRVVQDRMKMISKSAKLDAQASVEARAALSDAINRNADLQSEVQRLRLENTSLKEQLNLIHQGVRVRLQ